MHHLQFSFVLEMQPHIRRNTSHISEYRTLIFCSENIEHELMHHLQFSFMLDMQPHIRRNTSHISEYRTLGKT